MSLSIQEIEKIKKEAEEAKIKVAQLEGKSQTNKERLKEFGLNSLEETEDKLNSLDDELKDLETKRDGLSDDLQEKYDKAKEVLFNEDQIRYKSF